MPNKSESLNELAAALSLAQAVMHGAEKNAANPFFKSSYADLKAVWQAIRAPLTDNGLSITQTVDFEDDRMFVTTTLLHKSGQWIEGRTPVRVTKPDAQAMGSAITYARRYGLAAIAGVYQVDDDAESAVDNKTQPQPPQAAETAKWTPATAAKIQNTKHAAKPVDGSWGDYKIPFGKFKDRHLSEVTTAELTRYCAWLKDSADKKKQPMDSDAKNLCAAVAEYTAVKHAAIPAFNPAVAEPDFFG